MRSARSSIIRTSSPRSNERCGPRSTRKRPSSEGWTEVNKGSNRSMARTPLTHPWTDQEIATLRVMLATGVSPRTAALKLRRKLSGVRRKIAQIHAGDQETAVRALDRRADDID